MTSSESPGSRPQDPTLVGRYLADKVTAQERAALETTLPHDPKLLAELEATARLKVGLARLHETGQLQGMLEESSRWRRVGKLLPLVAALAALGVGIALWRSAPHTASSTGTLASSPALLTQPAGHPLPIKASLVIFRKRSGGVDAKATLPESPGAVELRVLPTNTAPSGHYRLSVIEIRPDNSQELIGAVEDVVAAPDGFVTVYADASHLPSGRYRLLLSEAGSSDNGSPADRFEIELTRR